MTAMNMEDVVARVQAASGDPHKLALVTLDVVLSAHPPELRTALEAAAIPHWFTPAILARLLQIDQAKAHEYVERLRQLPMVEPFEARQGWNVHELTRLAVRSDLAGNQPDHFRELSMHAAGCFTNEEPHHRIEAIYHSLVADPVHASTALKTLYEEWDRSGRFEALQALGQALKELLTFIPLTAPARASSALFRGRISRSRLPLNEVEELAREALRFVADESDALVEMDAHDLLGDVLVEQGKLEQALAKYRAFEAIAQQLSQLDPDNAEWQRELSVSHNKVGSIYQAQGRLAEALTEYQAYKSILQRLSQLDPDNAEWQRDLSVSHNQVGSIYQAQGRLAEALTEYQAAKSIRKRLSQLDPDNTGWQRDTAISYLNVGSIHEAQDQGDEALREYQFAHAILERLVAFDPTNQQWQEDLRLTDALLAQVNNKL